MIIDFKTLRHCASAGDILFALLSTKKSGPIFYVGMWTYVGIFFIKGIVVEGNAVWNFLKVHRRFIPGVSVYLTMKASVD